VGGFFGLLIAFLISPVFSAINNEYIRIALMVFDYAFAIYLGMFVFAKSKPNIFDLQHLHEQFLAAGKDESEGLPENQQPKIFDTDLVLDGRIESLLETGFVEGKIIIPEFVLIELRHVADSADGVRRARGRKGLELLNRIQVKYGIEIYGTEQADFEGAGGPGGKLLKLAGLVNGKIVTVNSGLCKAAALMGLDVLDLNALCDSVKPEVLPGEDMVLFLAKEGTSDNQAIAYLDDGTMIVVEDGKKHIGDTMPVTVVSVRQTSSGRMFFAKLKKNLSLPQPVVIPG
jgi:uncharacterized protein YacL